MKRYLPKYKAIRCAIVYARRECLSPMRGTARRGSIYRTAVLAYLRALSDNGLIDE